VVAAAVDSGGRRRSARVHARARGALPARQRAHAAQAGTRQASAARALRARQRGAGGEREVPRPARSRQSFLSLRPSRARAPVVITPAAKHAAVSVKADRPLLRCARALCA
jgi:hypothetical protein